MGNLFGLFAVRKRRAGYVLSFPGVLRSNGFEQGAGKIYFCIVIERAEDPQKKEEAIVESKEDNSADID